MSAVRGSNSAPGCDGGSQTVVPGHEDPLMDHPRRGRGVRKRNVVMLASTAGVQRAQTETRALTEDPVPQPAAARQAVSPTEAVQGAYDLDVPCGQRSIRPRLVHQWKASRDMPAARQKQFQEVIRQIDAPIGDVAVRHHSDVRTAKYASVSVQGMCEVEHWRTDRISQMRGEKFGKCIVVTVLDRSPARATAEVPTIVLQ